MPPKTKGAGTGAGGKVVAGGPASTKGKSKSGVTDSDAKNLQKTFAEYDVDGSGEISLLELQHFFDKSSPDLKNIAADFIATLDKDGDGKVTFLELLKEMYPMTPSKRLNDIYRKYYPEAAPKVTKKRLLAPEQVEELKALFCIYDRDGSGMIDQEELLEALPSVGYNAEELKDLFVLYDRDSNGFLDIDEFLLLMTDVFQ